MATNDEEETDYDFHEISHGPVKEIPKPVMQKMSEKRQKKNRPINQKKRTK